MCVEDEKDTFSEGRIGTRMLGQLAKVHEVHRVCSRKPELILITIRLTPSKPKRTE